MGPNSVAAALPASLIARVRYEQGRLDEAEIHAHRPHVAHHCRHNVGLCAECLFCHGKDCGSSDEFRAGTHVVRKSKNLGNSRGWGRLTAAAVLERTRLCLREGRIDEGVEHLNRLEQLAAEYPAPTNCARSDVHRYAALARACIASAQRRFDDAISILAALQRDLENVHDRHFALRVEMRAAIIKFQAEQVADALGSFRHIVVAFAEAGIYRTILDEGAEVGPLLLAFQESSTRTSSLLELRVVRVKPRLGLEVAPPA